jgi:hypothetical protein
MKDDVVRNYGVMKEMKHSVTPFDAALWTYASKHSGHISTKSGKSLLHHTYLQSKMPTRTSEVAPVRNISREIKMMSLNPSVYGNCYGVLGSS